MQIQTTYAGEISYTESDIIWMEKGFYGFPNSKRFIQVGEFTPEFPFVWFQSLDENDLCFIMTNPFLFMDAYDFEIDDELAEAIGVTSPSDVEVFTTVTVASELAETTINLKSPVMINRNNRQGEQVILTEEYAYKHPIFKKGDA